MSLQRRAVALVALIVTVTAATIVLIMQLTVSNSGEAHLNMGGPGLPIQLKDQNYDGELIPVRGELHVAENGCFEVSMDGRNLFAIWPRGWKMDGAAVVAPDGARFTQGSPLAGEGILMSFDALIEEDGGPDGYWGNVAGYCMENDDELVVVEYLG